MYSCLCNYFDLIDQLINSSKINRFNLYRQLQNLYPNLIDLDHVGPFGIAFPAILGIVTVVVLLR
jgi:hypothetical protein